MSTSRNTPWRREWQDGLVVVVDMEGEIVCRIEEWSEQVDQEDGDLIAAAPDMLEALRYVEARCVSEAAYQHASIEDRKKRDMVVAAIAKAEGRS